jgi:hypothetical protein
MMIVQQPPNVQLSAHLRQLLAAPPYRKMWERHVRHRRSGDISQAAVARVIAEHLLDSGERPFEAGDLDRQLKDRVARALSGRSLSGATLQWIIDAFDISNTEAAALWSLFTPPPIALPAPRPMPYRNVAIHELHTLGADGLPAFHRTVQVIEAGAEPVSQYTYRFDTNTVDVQVLRGGRAGPIYDSGDGIFAVDIKFSRTVAPGQTASLEYLTTFCYREPPPCEFRRASVRQIDSLEVGIQFHPGRLPRHLHWTTWATLDGPPIPQEEMELDPEHSAHRFVQQAAASILGFTWEW